MKKDQSLILAGVAAAALLYYYFASKKTPAAGVAARPSNLPGGQYVAPGLQVAPGGGAPIPTLATAASSATTQLLGNILQTLGSAASKALGTSSPSTSVGGGGPTSGGPKFPPPQFSPSPSNPPSQNQPGGVNPSDYYYDPSTGLTIDLKSGDIVSGQPTTPGIPYVGDQGSVTSTDLGSVDLNGSDSGASYDSSGSINDTSAAGDFNSSDFSSGDFSGGDVSGGGGDTVDLSSDS